MKKITNNTLGIVGIALLALSYIAGATDSNGKHLYSELATIWAIIHVLFVILASMRLWKLHKYFVISYVAINVLVLLTYLISFKSLTFFIFITHFILNIIIIVSLFTNKNTDKNDEILS